MYKKNMYKRSMSLICSSGSSEIKAYTCLYRVNLKFFTSFTAWAPTL